MATATATRQIIDLGYRPRPPFIKFHQRKERWACLVAHRRAGKTVACVMDLLDAALRCKKSEGRFGYVAPYYVQAKDAAWTYAKRFAAPVPGVSINESELRIDFAHNGARLRLYGADNYDRMRGSYFDGVILDEYGDMHPAAWPEVVRPMLADRKGWATFIGTPKGRNDFFQVWERSQTLPDWFSLMLKGEDSGLLDKAELEAMKAEMAPEQYEQEIQCNFNAAVVGAYYGKEIVAAENEKRIRSVPWEPSVPVDTAWDLGINDATAVWFVQTVGQEIRVIDYYEVQGQSLIQTAKVLRSDKPYMYGTHYLPHDVEVKELTTAKTRKETLESCNIRPISVGAASPVEDGINAARLLFPKCWFDAEKCKAGLEALRQYRTEYDEKRKVFKSTPLHDWTSHAADAFRYLAVNLRPKVKPVTLDYSAMHRGLA